MCKRFIKCSSMLMLLMAMASCVNEEYDLSNGVDMEMTVLPDACLPVGNIEKITLDKILLIEEDEENSLISTDQDGNYSLRFSGEKINVENSIPEFGIGNYDFQATTVNFHTGALAGMEPGVTERVISYQETYGKPLTFAMDIEIDEDLPDEIKDIRTIVFEQDQEQMSIHFTVPAGAVYVREGFTVTFSEDIVLVPCENDDYKVTEQTITFKKDLKISATAPYDCSFMVDALVFPKNSVAESRISYIDHLEFEGDIYIKTSDYQVIPSIVNLDVTAALHDFKVDYAEVMLDVKVDIEDTSFAINEIPDFLNGNDVCIDLYNPQLWLDIYNGTPLPFTLSAGITSYSEGRQQVNIPLGPYSIASGQNNSIVISRREIENVTGEGIYDVKPQIGEFFTSIPDLIELSDVAVVTEEEFIRVSPDDGLDVSVDYGFVAPLSFGENLSLDFNHDVKDLNLSFEGGLKSAGLSLVIVNSIPAEFTISASGLDSEGNVLSGLNLTIDKTIAAGSHVSPVETALTLLLTNSSDVLELDGLRLNLKANAASAEYQGVSLNKNQGLELKNLVLTLPDGFTFGTASEN